MNGRSIVLGAGATTLLLSGCASASGPDVSAVASAFEDPAGDPQARCALLAPATLTTFEADESAPCETAIGDVPLPGGDVSAVQVWGRAAQVRLGDDTVFLTETSAGWKVTAAGCQERGEGPYDCEVDGP